MVMRISLGIRPALVRAPVEQRKKIEPTTVLNAATPPQSVFTTRDPRKGMSSTPSISILGLRMLLSAKVCPPQSNGSVAAYSMTLF